MVRDILFLGISFSIIDALWIGVIAHRFYKSHLGSLLRTTPRWTAAVLFYVIYIIGLYLFALQPGLHEHSLRTAVLHGAGLGFLAYATYDLTNLSTLKHWPVAVTLVDIIWGTCLSAGSVGLTYLIVEAL